MRGEELRNGTEIGVEVLLTTHLKTQISNLKPQPSNLKSQISIRNERTHGYQNTSSGSQEVLDAC